VTFLVADVGCRDRACTRRKAIDSLNEQSGVEALLVAVQA
jgi:hypothetical protein